MSYTFSFLVYYPRSGSTLLAKQLSARAPGLLVLPEIRLTSFLLAREPGEVATMTADQVRRTVLADWQFTGSLALSRSDVDEIAARSPRSARSILESVVEKYAQRIGAHQATSVLIKRGGLLRLKDRVLEEFPEARFLNIARDGRAAVSSRLATERAYRPGENMGSSDVIACAREWVLHQELCGKIALEQKIPFLSIRYEDLVFDTATVVETALSFLGVGDYKMTPANQAGSASFRVADREQRIHSLADRPPDATHIDMWQARLPRWQAIACEHLLGEALTDLGYERFFVGQASWAERELALSRAWLLHVMAQIRATWRVLIRLAEPREAYERFRLRRATHRQGP